MVCFKINFNIRGTFKTMSFVFDPYLYVQDMENKADASSFMIHSVYLFFFVNVIFYECVRMRVP